MTHWKGLQRYWYLIAASAAILIATLALVFMQYRSVRHTEAQARENLTANLDIHLLALVDEAKRDMVSHADHITHSIYQRLVRERDLPGLTRAFTRASRRFPEVKNFHVVFFEGGREAETWKAFLFVPPVTDAPADAPEKSSADTYLGVPVGSLIEQASVSEALRRAWLSTPQREEIATYTIYAPLSLESSSPTQIFLHPVYESASMDRQGGLNRVGLIALTADVETYPSPDYLNKLVARYENLTEGNTSLLGKLSYSVRLKEQGGSRDLVAHDNQAAPLRVRGFNRSDQLFPALEFGVAPGDALGTSSAGEYTRSSILLGLCAAALTFIGLGLTWRATRREMKVAQLKSDFLANISHELKTPLTAIRAFGDLLHSGRARDAGRVREYGGIIKTESDRLTSLINNILEMSRLERGIRRYRLENGDLCEAVAGSVEVFRHTAEARECAIEVSLPSRPVRVQFDEGAIHQALLNLLSNAAKYSAAAPTGASRIEVAVKCDAHRAIVEVKDSGIGIAKAELRNIFTPFHRSPQPDAQAKGGTGLGLAVVREVANAHGGKVSVESELGLGTTFRLHLPLPSHPADEVSQADSENQQTWQTS